MNESYSSEPKSRKSLTLEFVKKLMITQYFDVMSTPKILEKSHVYNIKVKKQYTYLNCMHCFRFSVLSNK